MARIFVLILVHYTFPCAKGQVQLICACSVSQRDSEMKKTRVLVVEDEVIIAMDIEERLVSLGYEVPAMASSAEEAILVVTEMQPDLVLMDIMLM